MNDKGCFDKIKLLLPHMSNTDIQQLNYDEILPFMPDHCHTLTVSNYKLLGTPMYTKYFDFIPDVKMNSSMTTTLEVESGGGTLKTILQQLKKLKSKHTQLRTLVINIYDELESELNFHKKPSSNYTTLPFYHIFDRWLFPILDAIDINYESGSSNSKRYVKSHNDVCVCGNHHCNYIKFMISRI
jgi:hypothetical protein